MKCDYRVMQAIRLLLTGSSYIRMSAVPCRRVLREPGHLLQDVTCPETLLDFPSAKNILLNILNSDKICPLRVDLIFGNGTMHA